MERKNLRLTRPVPFMKRVVKYTAALLIAWAAFLNHLYAWEKVKEDFDAGITVYTRAVAGSSFKEFRAVMQIDTTLSSLVALVEDISACGQWIHTCKTGRLLKRINGRASYQYTINEAPWPVSDRDAVVYQTISQDPENQSVTVNILGVADYIPPQKDLVRVKKIKGYWRFTPLGGSRVEVVYQVHNDPGGSLPSWLVNSAAVSQPFNTLLNMRKMVNHPKYRKAGYDYIKEK